jgi:hypothetical protein
MTHNDAKDHIGNSLCANQASQALGKSGKTGLESSGETGLGKSGDNRLGKSGNSGPKN